jgi:hypothetical protein
VCGGGIVNTQPASPLFFLYLFIFVLLVELGEGSLVVLSLEVVAKLHGVKFLLQPQQLGVHQINLLADLPVILKEKERKNEKEGRKERKNGRKEGGKERKKEGKKETRERLRSLLKKNKVEMSISL